MLWFVVSFDSVVVGVVGVVAEVVVGVFGAGIGCCWC